MAVQPVGYELTSSPSGCGVASNGPMVTVVNIYDLNIDRFYKKQLKAAKRLR
ncbi:hypothetical protein DPMN_014760 [Dreissena polymorpha]|uniref:Uncharacterized protein n=1 Tax=Dreissena polymorpha TaxID=45954 RepID=A0A9D4N7Y0_DREPO|nr:hypothetical protein DPMN_014760 [Dreissena polymorpha]